LEFISSIKLQDWNYSSNTKHDTQEANLYILNFILFNSFFSITANLSQGIMIIQLAKSYNTSFS
jgi:hypothetical protein